VDLVQFVAICESSWLALATECKAFHIFGTFLFLLVPIPFLACSLFFITRSVKNGDLRFDKAAEQLPLKKAMARILKAPTLLSKILAYRYWSNSRNTAGSWRESEHAAWWSFFIGIFIGKAWFFAAWILTKKILLTSCLTLADGRSLQNANQCKQSYFIDERLQHPQFIACSDLCEPSIAIFTSCLFFKVACDLRHRFCCSQH
jgi:hypothetical protein